jgi:hypothetical protein
MALDDEAAGETKIAIKKEEDDEGASKDELSTRRARHDTP